MLKRTSLYDRHVAAGARMVGFAGWDMPVSYRGILDEVRAVRSDVGIFDVSHMGEIRVTGASAFAAVQSLFTNDAAALSPGRAQYTLMCREDGGILDDLIVYRWDAGEGDSDYFIVVNASNRDADYQWMTAHASGASVDDISDSVALLAVQGPRAVDLVAGLLDGANVLRLKPFSHVSARMQCGLDVHIARTGYTGEDGFEIVCAWEDAPVVWDATVSAGAAPCGLGARDVLRLEASFPLYGHEITQNTNPYEAGLGWVVKPSKGEFIGKSSMLVAREAGLSRRLCGILPEDARAIPREGAPVETPYGDGCVTSGTFSPTLSRAIAMAYLPAHAGGQVTLPMRGRTYPANVVKLPFYRRASS